VRAGQVGVRLRDQTERIARDLRYLILHEWLELPSDLNPREHGIARLLHTYLLKARYERDNAYLLLGICQEKHKMYDSALYSYQQAYALADGDSTGEGALYRIGKLLYFHSDDDRAARSALTDYIASYPHGAWREEEYYYLMKVFIRLAQFAECDSVLKGFAAEFPQSCLETKIRRELVMAR
jgi:hypothetical protein